MFASLRKITIIVLAVLAFVSIRPDSPVHAQSGSGRGSVAATPQSAPLGKSKAEKQILAVLDDLDRNQKIALDRAGRGCQAFAPAD